MPAVLKFAKLLCLALLVGSLIISTKWIYKVYLPGQVQNSLSTLNLEGISWYVTAPLLILFFLLQALEIRIYGRRD